jgi:hypothetical protein
MGRVARFGYAFALFISGSAIAFAGPGADGAHHDEGQYGGVDPAGTPSPDARIARPPANTLGWVGFRATDGIAVVFFQAAQPFTITQRVEAGQVVVALDGLIHQARNTRRPLDTHFFDAPIARITATTTRSKRARRGHPAHVAGVTVRIGFQAGAPVTEGVVTTATEKDGLFYTYLTFPASAPPPPTR